MEARLSAGGGRRGGSRGGGGAAVDTAAGPETTWDDQGREWRRGPSGRWIPVKPTGGDDTAPKGKVWIPELGGYGTPDQAFQVRSKQAGLLGKQAEDISREQEDYGLKPDVKPAAHGYVMKDGKHAFENAREQVSYVASPGDPLTDSNA
jgi:hypothetical protein